jgi:hypothetical protein
VFSEWERIFTNPLTTAAAIDRLVHHAVILEFNVPSYRTADAQERQRAAAPSDPAREEEPRDDGGDRPHAR